MSVSHCVSVTGCHLVAVTPGCLLIVSCCRMLACDYEVAKPDLLILGKALSGGVLPVSVEVAFAYS